MPLLFFFWTNLKLWQLIYEIKEKFMNKTFKRLLREYTTARYNFEYYSVKYDQEVSEYKSYLDGTNVRMIILKLNPHELRRVSSMMCKRYKTKVKYYANELAIIGEKISRYIKDTAEAEYLIGKLVSKWEKEKKND